MITSSCSEKDNNINIPEKEEFYSVNRPFFSYDKATDQYILKPWNYDEPYNSERKYPLLIFLHGSGAAGNISYLSHIGYDNPNDGQDNETALEFQKKHSCFVLVPQTNSHWDYSSLINQVENFKQMYRVDVSRIYLIGYSMGGSGSYAFINSYYDYNQQLFAGVVRLAGQSQTEIRNTIAEQTAIWIHIGLDDVQLRIDITREAYRFYQNYHNNATEVISSVPIESIDGLTYSLMINNKDRFKRTEYVGIGHSIASMPFRDPYVLKWLFSQQLNDH